MRLTERDGNKVWFAHGRPRGFLCPREFCDNAYSCQNVKDRTCPYLQLLDKFAAYEDAEEQGLLVRLPQKTVYAIGWGEGKDCDHICPASIDGVGCCSLCDNGELIIYEEECHQEHLPHIGKTVFLTCEEAEAALKGERGKMYEELVKRLHQRIALTTAGSPLQDDLLEAADAIEELQHSLDIMGDANAKLRDQEPEWVPVTERLPEKRDC